MALDPEAETERLMRRRAVCEAEIRKQMKKRIPDQIAIQKLKRQIKIINQNLENLP